MPDRKNLISSDNPFDLEWEENSEPRVGNLPMVADEIELDDENVDPMDLDFDAVPVDALDVPDDDLSDEDKEYYNSMIDDDYADLVDVQGGSHPIEWEDDEMAAFASKRMQDLQKTCRKRYEASKQNESVESNIKAFADNLDFSECNSKKSNKAVLTEEDETEDVEDVEAPEFEAADVEEPEEDTDEATEEIDVDETGVEEESEEEIEYSFTNNVKVSELDPMPEFDEEAELEIAPIMIGDQEVTFDSMTISQKDGKVVVSLNIAEVPVESEEVTDESEEVEEDDMSDEEFEESFGRAIAEKRRR